MGKVLFCIVLYIPAQRQRYVLGLLVCCKVVGVGVVVADLDVGVGVVWLLWMLWMWMWLLWL